ncbi:hypothetical protein HRD49_45045, partial [Corallococcus exiguus]|uniref:hypothetical protein n=1 Tax=Corallococcus exiguus TaxID=83462 RepID=UPI001560158E
MDWARGNVWFEWAPGETPEERGDGERDDAGEETTPLAAVAVNSGDVPLERLGDGGHLQRLRGRLAVALFRGRMNRHVVFSGSTGSEFRELTAQRLGVDRTLLGVSGQDALHEIAQLRWNPRIHQAGWRRWEGKT